MLIPAGNCLSLSCGMTDKPRSGKLGIVAFCWEALG